MKKELILVGDKVLIEPSREDDKTNTGLYLPQGIKEKEKVQIGRVISVGPGYPVPDPSLLQDEPWGKVKKDKYFPLQAQEGDHCMFLRDQGIEIEFERKKYIVAPHSAILLIIRNSSILNIEEF